MGKADLTLTTFGNNPAVEKAVPDIYDEEAVSKFLKNEPSEALVSLKNVFPDIPSDALTLGPSSSFFGLGDTLDSLEEKISSFGDNNNFLEIIKTVMSDMPPAAQADKLLALYDLPTLSEGLTQIRKWLDPKQWNSITEEFVSDVFGHVGEITRSLGVDCTFCRSFCGEVANRYTGNDYSEGEIWKAAFLLRDIEELFKCKLAEYSIAALDLFTNGGVSDGTVGKVFSISAKIAAKYEDAEKVFDFIERAAGWFTEKDREETLVNMARGYTLDPKLNVSDYPAEANRLADNMSKINPNWYYLWMEKGNVLTTKYLYQTSSDFVKIMAYHSDYWPLSIIEKSFDPLTKPWKEIVTSDIPVLYFVE